MSSSAMNVTLLNGAGDKQKYILCLDKLSKVFDVVQSDDFDVNGKKQEKIRNKLLEEVRKIYNEVGLKAFSETLFRMMIVPFQSKDNPYVVKVIEFFYAMICDDKLGECSEQPNNHFNDTMSTMNGSVMEDGASEQLPVRILRLCERYHSEARVIARLRIMQTVSKIIERLQINEIRKNLQLKLIKMLLVRIKDKSDQVRALSASILCEFIGDNIPFQSQILSDLIERMRFDPDHIVRSKIVSCIKITDDTMEHIVERTGDQHAVVRAAAVNRVSADIKLASLTVEMRELILKANITEDAPKSIVKAVHGLLESWLNCLENDPCEFLRVLNVRRRPILCKTALDTLYTQLPEEAFEKMSKPLLNDKRYPDESLCIESTYLWLYMYKRFKDEQYIYNKLALPVVEMIEYINEYIEVVDDEGDLPQGDLEYRSNMLGDMLQILSFLPVEEGERKAILEYLPTLCLKKKLMDQRNSALVVKLVSVCSDLNDESHVIDLVNCLLDSDRPSVRKSTIKNDTDFSIELKSMNKDSPDSLTSLKLELGNLMHKMKKLERDRDFAVQTDDLFKAQEYQNQINELEAQIHTVKESIQEQATNSAVPSDNETMEEEEEQWTYSNKTMLLALSLVKTNILLLDRISDFSRTFYEMYAVKAVSKSRDITVRAMALELMCIVALDFEEEVARTTLYCLMALLRDSMDVKVAALKCLYDLVLRYSFAKLGGFPEVQGVLMGTKDLPKVQVTADDPASTLKSLLLSYIRHEEVKLVKVSVAGVLKLLFKKEMNSARLIVTFLVNWAIPSHDAQTRFKDVGTMIPVYASMGEKEAVEVAECLLSCVKKSLMKIHSRAQNDLLTPHPDINKIVTLIVRCTDPNRLTEFQRCYIAHETLAMGALRELRNTDLITEEKMHYAKLLKVLDLRQCPNESINQMIHLLSEIAETSNKTISQTLKGFSTYLELLADGEHDAAEPPAGAFENDDTNNEVFMDTS